MEKVVLALSVMLFFQVIVDLLIISEYRKRQVEYIGPKVGERFKGFEKVLRICTGEKYVFKKINNFLFFDVQCITCKELLKKIEKYDKEIKNLTLITYGDTKEIMEFYDSLSFEAEFYYIEKEEDFDKDLGITIYPFFIQTEFDKVIEKQFADIDVLIESGCFDE